MKNENTTVQDLNKEIANLKKDMEKIKKDNDSILDNISKAFKYKYHYEYPCPSLTADIIVFGFDKKDKLLKILLIQRGLEPFKGKWALPGGFAAISKKTGNPESIEECAVRELREETKFVIKEKDLNPIRVFSKYGRDSRGWNVTVPFFVIKDITGIEVEGGDDAAYARWIDVNNDIFKDNANLAFDHAEIIKAAKEGLKHKLYYDHVAFDLLGSSFTLTQIQEVYQAILGLFDDKDKFNRRNFQKKMASMEFLEKCNDETIDTSKELVNKNAQRYRFVEEKYIEYKKEFKLEF